MSNNIRLRFPPSPTGKIHIGNMRTALFNWLVAKQKDGELVLRIEDTDQARSTKEFENIIIQEMEWLGLDADEGVGIGGDYGPYRQTERIDLYQEYADKLLELGHAYKCYCTKEELDEMRKKAIDNDEMPRYDGSCRNLSEEERAAYEAEGREPVLRFRLPKAEKEIIVEDLIRGNVSFSSSVLDDFIIFKSDGMPTYNFAVVIDDALMKISHVIRGEDHLSNTPKQILIYEALGFDLPKFAHLPLILDENKAKLKKRGKDSVYIGEFREQGYLPEALFNFMALLGWSTGDEEEILSQSEIIDRFAIEDVNKSGAVFDREKLNWMNGKYIRAAELNRIVELSMPFLLDSGLVDDDYVKNNKEWLTKVIDEARTGVDYLSQIPGEAELFLTEIKFDDPAAAAEEFKGADVKLVFETLKEKIFAQDELTAEAVGQIFKELKNELDVGGRTIYHPTRLAITGKGSGPEMTSVISIFGAEEIAKRLDSALELAANY
ncbi:MAG: nondiscriminating glutamyl-tRNA synthetase [Halanaerobium sp. 4-GBenrich]|jgi:nondiscriminating glutamyl-tRNA synthetase|uniref:Glutamate--tRNA ligase n=1 Tax=Halanaerobium congolense TaxID=54121 RepID=A0A1G6SV70_9FIRM|nr:glutamate--tRNA ligase [Halanaerobium congolense]KXS49900.1 MAG: nondiscriminating glutamyl-tRNA synthetase [Halanaerobium sp. T82-1]ODS50738.1 MAG: nondiscriminating glutamyl-tRNA synthetase [Halanaerobium sp. 4-GBenrich]PUU92208.1 MAG: nondiscriminating glutamyl-tRNA synthetase [Halanaerobium sp.]PTX15580.1 glutamyl-tRNA synthetase /glutamate--tRNA(Gln) ligase [Halanaerobium congolense]PXV62425.1 glutamyl-tRNA synthetase /glutamate--tRNA(Gln) ligase [Halanaerobium congolense]